MISAVHWIDFATDGNWRVLISFFFISASAAAGNQAAAAVPARTPAVNFLIVLADDLGYGDLRCYGDRDIKSPHLDEFARQGLRLTQCYAAAPVCSPARAGLLTGRIPYRVGIHNWIPFMSPMHLRSSEITVATLLSQAGYDTCHTGKWHLNGLFNLPGQPQPLDHGFRYWFSTQNNALPNHRNPYNFVRNGIPAGPLEGYAAQLVAKEAIHWLRNVRDESKPFFLFVCFHEPHEPIATDEKFSKLYRKPDDPSYSAHHGNITQMDHAFGMLMRTLDELKLRDNTLVFFTSDNGPAVTHIHPHGSAGLLREKKRHLYEGGIRVPGILRWPGHTRPDSVSDQPISGVDVLPTLCDIAGIDLPEDRAIDGSSFLPVITGKPMERKTPLFWQYNRAPSKPKVAMRLGDYKILAHLDLPDPKPGADIFEEEQRAAKTARLVQFELYHLGRDIGEAHNLAETEPQKLKKLAKKMRELYRDIQQESPTWPAWTWPRYEGKRIEWPSYRGKRR